MNLSSLVASDYIELLILCKKKNHFFSQYAAGLWHRP